MKTRTLGISILIVGIVMMIYTGFNYVTTEKVVDLGPIKISKEKEHPVQWSPFIGIALTVVGVLVIAGDKKSRV